MREPGIYHGIPNADYHAFRGAIGCSGLKAIRRSPAYYYGQYLDPNRPPKEEKESAGRFFGNITHCSLFEPDELNRRYRIGPVVSSKNVKAWQEFKRECEADGAQAIDAEQYKMALAVRERVLAVPGIAKWFEPGKWAGEVTVVARDPDTGILRKVRCDLLHDAGDDRAVIVDGKSYADVATDAFTRQVAAMDYDMQGAFYSDTVRLAGKNVLGFLFLVFEDEYPYCSRLFELDEEGFLNGRRKYRAALNTYAECVKTGVWPGHPDTIETITLPKYALEYTA